MPAGLTSTTQVLVLEQDLEPVVPLRRRARRRAAGGRSRTKRSPGLTRCPGSAIDQPALAQAPLAHQRLQPRARELRQPARQEPVEPLARRARRRRPARPARAAGSAGGGNVRFPAPSAQGVRRRQRRASSSCGTATLIWLLVKRGASVADTAPTAPAGEPGTIGLPPGGEVTQLAVVRLAARAARAGAGGGAVRAGGGLARRASGAACCGWCPRPRREPRARAVGGARARDRRPGCGGRRRRRVGGRPGVRAPGACPASAGGCGWTASCRRVAGGRRRWPAWPTAPRATPPCPHFGRCGGCRLQHLPPDLYAAHKRGRIVEALARRGLPGEVVGEVRVTPPASRRRLRLGLAPAPARRLLLGFRERGSHRLEPVDVVPDRPPELAGAAAARWRRSSAAALDAPEPAEAEPDPDRYRPRPAACTPVGAPSPASASASPPSADRLDLARVSWAAGGEPPSRSSSAAGPRCDSGRSRSSRRRAPSCRRPRSARRALAAAVAEWGRGAPARRRPVRRRRHADLRPRRRRGRAVRAVEGDAASAGGAAAGRGRRPPRRRRRRRRATSPAARSRPPSCKGVDLAVLDPPRAGAPEQARELAASARCRAWSTPPARPRASPATPAPWSTAASRCVEVRPIDQFLYAAEVELVARFARPAAAEKRP